MRAAMRIVARRHEGGNGRSSGTGGDEPPYLDVVRRPCERMCQRSGLHWTRHNHQHRDGVAGGKGKRCTGANVARAAQGGGRGFKGQSVASPPCRPRSVGSPRCQQGRDGWGTAHWCCRWGIRPEPPTAVLSNGLQGATGQSDPVYQLPRPASILQQRGSHQLSRHLSPPDPPRQ